MEIPENWEWDAERWAAAVRAHPQFRARVEVWFQGEQKSASAPFSAGVVTDTRVIAGQRRTLAMTVPPSWQRWFDLPGYLELRPYSGLIIGGQLVEVPQGRFLLPRPGKRWPAADVSFTANDYWTRVVKSNFPGPRVSPGGKILDQAAILMMEAGLGWAEITATSTYSAGPKLLENKTRTEAVAAFMKSVSAEAWLDRRGNPRIVDAIGIGAPTSSIERTAESALLESDNDKVYNQVAVRSSAQDVDFGTITREITSPYHPASPQQLGYTNVYNFASPLLTDPAQGAKAADTLLARVSSLAESYSYECLPDPTRDAGDTIAGITVGQIESVTHPLTLGVRQMVTTVNTQPDPDE